MQMQYYAEHKHSLADNLGYSMLMYNESLSLYCVHNREEEYNTIRILLTTAACFLAFFFSIGTPTILVGVYGRLHKKMADRSRDWQYIVWAVAIVAFFLTPAMIAADIFFVSNYKRNMDHNTIICYCFLVVTVVTGLLTVALGLCYIISIRGTITVDGEILKFSDFPVPHALELLIYAFDRFCGFGCKSGKNVVIFLACSSFTHFLVLVGFHGIYMILGVVASPIVILSRISFYITASLCLVAFTAFFLKFSDKSQCDKLCKTDVQEKYFKVIRVISYVPPVLSAFLLFASVVMFGVFYYYFSIVINNWHNDDFLSILGSFLPSALLAFASFCGKELMNCLKEKETDPELQMAQALQTLLSAAGNNNSHTVSSDGASTNGDTVSSGGASTNGDTVSSDGASTNGDAVSSGGASTNGNTPSPGGGGTNGADSAAFTGGKVTGKKRFKKTSFEGSSAEEVPLLGSQSISNYKSSEARC